MSERTVKARGVEGSLQLGRASTGTEQVGGTFEITEGERAGERKLWIGFLSDAAIDRTFEALCNCGWATPDFQDAFKQFHLNEVELLLRDEAQKDGTLIERVAFVNQIGRGRFVMKDQMNENEVRAFAARVKGKAVALQQSRAVQPRPQTARGSQSRQSQQQDDFAGSNAGYDDSDIPF
jgi:hypothetical protein